ncbi:hypothetical protein PR202_gb11944 [Eleusine coracana subsp. coracana]|uniref:Uncharacterized protein n=1 Tax=Eleusine coracana subsp. coracana TaxID=191504 RepID=A0AAV5ENY4_ELECO|nr:hypothetical protein PR202_gb11944 [Eleusine coracana subsp. coracana]
MQPVFESDASSSSPSSSDDDDEMDRRTGGRVPPWLLDSLMSRFSASLPTWRRLDSTKEHLGAGVVQQDGQHARVVCRVLNVHSTAPAIGTAKWSSYIAGTFGLSTATCFSITKKPPPPEPPPPAPAFSLDFFLDGAHLRTTVKTSNQAPASLLLGIIARTSSELSPPPPLVAGSPADSPAEPSLGTLAASGTF